MNVEEVAQSEGWDVRDVLLVCQIELIVPDEFIPESESVTDRGLVILREHFAGGVEQ